jgi:archaetidylinositol phosphate synthase
MTLDQFRETADRAIGPFVTVAKRLGMTPNAVSVVSLGMAIAAGAAFALGGQHRIAYLVGAFCVFFNGWLDLVDGALARELSVDSPAGDLLDHVIDRYADIVMIVGLAAGVGRYDLGLAAVTGVLMTSYLGTQAQAVGLDRVYAGLVGRADRLAIIGLVGGIATFAPGTIASLGLVEWLLVFLAVVGHLTALQRFYSAVGALR